MSVPWDKLMGFALVFVLCASMAWTQSNPPTRSSQLHLMAGLEGILPSPQGTATGFGAHAGAFFDLSRGLAAMVLLDFSAFASEEKGPLGEGSFRLQMVSAGVVFRPFRATWSPFLTAGGAFQFSAFSLRNVEIFQTVGLDVASTPKSGPGFFVGAGVERHITDRWGLWLWGRKFFMRVRMRITVTDLVTGASFEQETDPIGLNPWMFHLTLWYRF